MTYSRPCSLTEAGFAACGIVTSAHSEKRLSVGFFSSKKMSLSTTGIFLSCTLIGLAYPLFYTYLANKGAIFHRTQFETWRNYALINISGIPGPIVAVFMCNTMLGRKYTIAIGAMITMASFFAHTAVQTSMQDLTLTCTLYAYTPKLLPSAHRTIVNSIAVACNIIMGIISAIVASDGNTGTSAPLYVCAALSVGMAGVSVLFPSEPYGHMVLGVLEAC
ncbi:synaptic vesicle transporter SV2 (major facilitator superfamily) [Colletotrichum asianum]